MTWRNDAACKGMDTNLFFPPVGVNVHPAARAACASCPVHTECLNHALHDRELVGWWAGTTFDNRVRIRGRLKKAGTPIPPSPPTHHRPRAECGTNAGYHAHRTRHEPTCHRCSQAHNQYSAEHRASKKKTA